LLYISQSKYVNKASVITFCIFIFFQYRGTVYTVQPIGPIKNMFFKVFFSSPRYVSNVPVSFLHISPF
jgi:hypothetical protein